MIILLDENGVKIAETDSVTPNNPFLQHLKNGYSIQKKTNSLWCLVAADEPSPQLPMNLIDDDSDVIPIDPMSYPATASDYIQVLRELGVNV